MCVKVTWLILCLPVFFFYQIYASLSLSDPVFMWLFFLSFQAIFLYFLTLLPSLNSFPFHCLPEFKKWDIVAPSTPSSVHVNVNYFWECEIFFPIWNRNSGFSSSFSVTFRFSLFLGELLMNHGVGSLGNLWGLSPSFTEPHQSHLWTLCFWRWLTVYSILLGGNINTMVIIHCRGMEWLKETQVFILVWWIVLYLIIIPVFLFEASSSWLTRFYPHLPPLYT